MTPGNSAAPAPSETMPPPASKLNWLRFFDVAIFLIFAILLLAHWQSDRHHWIGAAISLPGFILWITARQQLGASFAVRAEAKKLVTHGLYSRIRNPIYLFGAVAFIGEFIALGWYVAIPLFIVMNLFQFPRIKREEQVLTEAFGDEYRAYKTKTWF